ncbi:MAG: helix-turn-helix domain-containing protein [Actinomycetota bacterium]|nr:helix-turn-helix transcriptional regulator [Actinomycetota bacterium]MDQ3086878.1 helix-turn-helix domain-containing protein [Actinomycetota bacterium]
MTAGELLRETRRRHGLTQRQLAIRARTSQAAISRIERGVVSPTVETLAELLWMMNEELVLGAEPVDWGHDMTLNQANLAIDPEARIRRGVVYSRRMAQIRGVAARAGT